jgi:hypothetical protein
MDSCNDVTWIIVPLNLSETMILLTFSVLQISLLLFGCIGCASRYICELDLIIQYRSLVLPVKAPAIDLSVSSASKPHSTMVQLILNTYTHLIFSSVY